MVQVRSKKDSLGRQMYFIDGKRVSKEKALKAKGAAKPKKAATRKPATKPRCTAKNPCAKTKYGKHRQGVNQRRKKKEGKKFIAPTYYAYAKCSNPPPCGPNDEDFTLQSGEKCCRKKSM